MGNIKVYHTMQGVIKYIAHILHEGWCMKRERGRYTTSHQLYQHSITNYCTIRQMFTILGNFHAEMAENFSFDLRRIKKKYFFFDMTHDVNIWSK